MTITLTPDIESALTEAARLRGTTPEALALESLQATFVPPDEAPLSDEEFEALVNELDEAVAEAGGDKIPPLPDHALTRDGIYGDHP